MVEPIVIPRSEHALSRRDVDPDALKVLYRLKEAGFIAYLVGGGVRDLLLDRRPKDFDIGTSAHPYQVKRLFRNCWVIGRRFRLVHVKFGQKIIEVATFRRHFPPSDAVEEPQPHEGGEAGDASDRARERAARDLLIPPRQYVRHAGGGRVPPRLHRQRAVLRHRDLLHYRLRRRLARSPRAGHSRDRRSGRAVPRRPGAHAARRRVSPSGSASRSTRPSSTRSGATGARSPEAPPPA